jgi:hypothetical protein
MATTTTYLDTTIQRPGIIDKIISWFIRLVGSTAVNAVDTATDVAIIGSYSVVKTMHQRKAHLEGIADLVEDLGSDTTNP